MEWFHKESKKGRKGDPIPILDLFTQLDTSSNLPVFRMLKEKDYKILSIQTSVCEDEGFGMSFHVHKKLRVARNIFRRETPLEREREDEVNDLSGSLANQNLI